MLKFIHKEDKKVLFIMHDDGSLEIFDEKMKKSKEEEKKKEDKPCQKK